VTDPGGVAVQTEDLLEHAKQIDGHAGALGTVLDAAAATAPGMNAYGHLCAMVPSLLGDLQQRIVGGLSAAEESLVSTAAGLRRSAADYEQAERHSATAFKQVANVLQQIRRKRP